jgi:PrtD family type I secretion system ABC transporter
MSRHAAILRSAQRLASSSRHSVGAMVATLQRRMPLLPASTPELRDTVKACRPALIGVAIESSLINLLMLTGPLFMLQVYDRVLPSGSVPTLIGLFSLAAVMYAMQGVLDVMRSRILTRLGRLFDERLSPRIFDSIVQATLRNGVNVDTLQAGRDLDTVRFFIASPGLAALFDLPWIPLYVGICFLFHPLMGLAVLIGAAFLCAIAWFAEVAARAPTRELVALASARRRIAEATRRNAALILALGMRGKMAARWAHDNDAYLDMLQYGADLTGSFGSLSRSFRMLLQSAVLGVGAYLVIEQQATPGVMLAATILTIRALAPVEMAIANWKNFIAAQQSWFNLSEILAQSPPASEPVLLPPPERELRCTSVSLTAPSSGNVILHDVSFTLAAGAALGIVGPSGSGKSSLGRTLVGAWKPARGVIRLDGSTLDQWNSDALGRRIGYLPQDVELLAGSVAENIARFDPSPDPEDLIAAATAADVMDLIRMLPDGFDTQVGEGGALLSGGQRQRIALARALYGNPFLVVLDEPNSNLDAQGETALIRAIARVRQRRGIAIVITHRPSVLVAVDSILVLNGGRVQSIGPRDAILNGGPREQKPHSNGAGQQPSPPMAPLHNGARRTAKRQRDVTA